MKRIFAGFLTLCLLAALTVPCLAAESGGVVQTVKALGILTGDESGNTDLYGAVSRAEFASMMVAASSYKDSVSREGSGYSLYKDVKSGYWASEAIQLAVQQGWMTGYTDRTFRPEQAVTLEEACAALLKLLGYDSSVLAGSFPQAQLSKASSLGLRDGVSAARGQTLTRQNCAYLFYNLLTAKTGEGQVYGESLGYTVSNGEVDYTSVALDQISGPFIAESSVESLPFEPEIIYKNDQQTKTVSITRNDVYYYNEAARTVWIYTKRISGRIEALSPSTSEPTSVTVSRNAYNIGSSTANYKLSAVGGGKVGSIVTLLLGMNDSVVDILTGSDVDTTYYGVVESFQETVDGEKATVYKEITVFCTDGVTREFQSSEKFAAGLLVSIDITNSGTTIKRLNQKTTSGKVDESASTLGRLRIAPDIQILDISKEGNAVVVDPNRLAGHTLKDADVRYYALNKHSEISTLILNDATGDTWSYGYLISVWDGVESSGDEGEGSGTKTVNYTYTYMLNGEKQSLQTGAQKYFVEGQSGIAVRYNSSGEVKEIKNIAGVELTELGTFTVRVDNKTYEVAEHVQVYLKQNGGYYLAEYSSVNAEDYTLMGYYDDFGCPAGGQIRVIIAEKK